MKRIDVVAAAHPTDLVRRTVGAKLAPGKSGKQIQTKDLPGNTPKDIRPASIVASLKIVLYPSELQPGWQVFWFETRQKLEALCIGFGISPNVRGFWVARVGNPSV